MPKEKKETIEIKQKIILPPSGDNETDQELIDNFLSHSDDEYKQMGEEIEEAERKREDEEKKKEEPLQELKDFRELWKQGIEGISKESKEKIIETVDKIPVEVEKDSDGSRLIKIKLGNKMYRILDSKIENHTDDKYIVNGKYDWMNKKEIRLIGMIGDDVSNWENQKLKEYIKEKESEGLHIAMKEEMKNLLGELGKKAGLNKEEDQIAMLMYLTGMYGFYWLTSQKGNPTMRLLLRCDNVNRYFGGTYVEEDIDISPRIASFCMIAYEDITPEYGKSTVESTIFENIGSVGGDIVEYDESTSTVKRKGKSYKIDSFQGTRVLMEDLLKANDTTRAIQIMGELGL